MKKNILLGIILLGSFVLKAQGSYPIIPYPNKLIEAEGVFEFKGKLSVNFASSFKSELETMGKIFEEEYFTRLVPSKNGNLIVRQNSSLGKEAYKLTVRKDNILIEASAGTGCFYAFQTIRQLMKLNGTGAYQVPACQIEDQPAFSWRSFMLDEGRHFKGMHVAKQLLDEMALLKMNVFHWHLTEDQGWRIEIKKYPKLTEIGSHRDSTEINHFSSNIYDGKPHSGFYTQDEIKEIVAYAADRHILVVPEIEMPGHSSAAIAAYPWLGTTGKQIKVPCKFGVQYDIYNVTDPKVIGFLNDVIDEVIALFPSPVIHIGGDEVDYDLWNASHQVKSFMANNGLKTPAELQVFFTNNISNMLLAKKKRMMGWNEITGDKLHEYQSDADTKEVSQKLADGTIVQFWKGDSTLMLNTVKKGYDIVNSYHEYTYLDYDYKSIPLLKAYSFNPIPKGLPKEMESKVLGLGCQMWGEFIPTTESMQLKVFPRLAAYAEVGWTIEQNKDFDRFSSALVNLKKYWYKKGIYYFEE